MEGAGERARGGDGGAGDRMEVEPAPCDLLLPPIVPPSSAAHGGASSAASATPSVGGPVQGARAGGGGGVSGGVAPIAAAAAAPLQSGAPIASERLRECESDPVGTRDAAQMSLSPNTSATGVGVAARPAPAHASPSQASANSSSGRGAAPPPGSATAPPRSFARPSHGSTRVAAAAAPRSERAAMSSRVQQQAEAAVAAHLLAAPHIMNRLDRLTSGLIDHSYSSFFRTDTSLTVEDCELRALKPVYHNGWPEELAFVDNVLHSPATPSSASQPQKDQDRADGSEATQRSGGKGTDDSKGNVDAMDE